MPVVDRRDFGGRFDVIESAARLANYRYLEIQTMEMIAGWCHTTPEIHIKATMGQHVYEDAQRADQLGRRLAGLRSRRDRAEAPTDEFVRLCEKIWHASTTIERLIGVYRVLKPHLCSTYLYHAQCCDPYADEATQQLLDTLSTAVQSQINWANGVIDSYLADPVTRKLARAWQAELEEALYESGGVAGTGVEAHWLPYIPPVKGNDPPGKLLPHERRALKASQTGSSVRPKATYSFVKKCPPTDHPVVQSPFWFSDDVAVHRAYKGNHKPGSRPWFAETMYRLLYGEIDTVDRIGKLICEFPDLPWEMRLELAQQQWDEARHINMIAKVAQDLGAEPGSLPWHPYFWRLTQNQDDPLERLAVNNCWAEARLCNILHEWMKLAAENGDHKLAELFDYILADEIVHVDLATRWIRKLCEDDPERLLHLKEWATETARQIMVFQANAFGGMRPVDPADQEIRLSFA